MPGRMIMKLLMTFLVLHVIKVFENQNLTCLFGRFYINDLMLLFFHNKLIFENFQSNK